MAVGALGGYLKIHNIYKMSDRSLSYLNISDPSHGTVFIVSPNIS